jgi:hypothetical protein
MIIQPTMFGFSIAQTRQPDLFDGCAVPTGRHCSECGRELVETESDYHCCPVGHGKLLTPATADEQDDGDETRPASTWSQQVRRIAKCHAARDNLHGRRWRCGCGACSVARLDGCTPREHLARDR